MAITERLPRPALAVTVLASAAAGLAPQASLAAEEVLEFKAWAAQVERSIRPDTLRDDQTREEIPGPYIRLSRIGHADVDAKRRQLVWEISDPSGLAAIDVRLAMINSDTMEPTPLFRSAEAIGTLNLEELGKGPGLYALIVTAMNEEGQDAAAAAQYAYTAVLESCPASKVWWPAAR